MLAGARVEVAPYKRDPADFVLWKPSDDGRDRLGFARGAAGRPGWHIECSAMIRAHLGETIDIHGGGLDLIFPHHENEIAQSRCAHGGAPLARYWVHNGFVDMGAEKMSKIARQYRHASASCWTQGTSGETLRLALLSAHYRQPLAWTESLIAQSEGDARPAVSRGSATPSRARSTPACVDALADDLNTPLALVAGCCSAIERSGERCSRRQLPAMLLGLLGRLSRPTNGSGASGDASRHRRADRRARRGQGAPRLRRGRPHPRRAEGRGHRA